MKRNILLAFLLVGLILIEWGCNSNKISYRAEYTITGVKSTNWSKYKHYLRNLNRVDSLLILVEFESVKNLFEVSNTKTSNIYALSPAEIIPENSFDSIRVSSNSVDYTDNFTLFFEDVNLRDLQNEYVSFGTGEPLFLSFGIREPLKNEVDTFQFTFQFFDTEGNVFETTTEPIIITP